MLGEAAAGCCDCWCTPPSLQVLPGAQTAVGWLWLGLAWRVGYEIGRWCPLSTPGGPCHARAPRQQAVGHSSGAESCFLPAVKASLFLFALASSFLHTQNDHATLAAILLLGKSNETWLYCPTVHRPICRIPAICCADALLRGPCTSQQSVLVCRRSNLCAIQK